MLVLAIVALLVPLALSLRDRVDAEVRLQARSQAEVVAARAATLVRPPRRAELERLARRAARAVRGRVVVVGAGGRLLADSAGVAVFGAPYGSRPEIAGALRGDVVQTRRRSKTLDEELLATAVPIAGTDGTAGAVRVTQSTAAVTRSVRRTWAELGFIGLLVLALGLTAGALIARAVAQPIMRLEDAARRVAGGDLSARARVEGSAEQRALAQEFNGMTSRLAALIDAQRQFVADASHQLRTPLAGLRLRLEEARAQAGEDTQRADLDAAVVEVDRLAAIVADLLRISEAAEGGRTAATADPRAALQAAAERFAGSARAAGCELRVNATARVTAVACHPRDLDRILDVLIENALAYAPGAPVELAAAGTEVRVRDHGPGLAAGEEAAVFERFHRGRAGTGGPPGTGLGLSIARELARRWGGELTIANAPGGGAMAALRLPAAVGQSFANPLP